MTRSDNLTGALLMMASMACFVLNDTFMKAIGNDVPLNQLVFLRGLITTAAVLVMAWRMKALFVRPTRTDAALIGLRTLAEIGMVYFFLTALFNMPLANITAILQALPLTVTLGAALVFKERIGWRRMAAIVVGFAGVLLIVRPGSEGFTIYSVYGLAAIVCVTVRDLSTRKLSPDMPSMFVTLINGLAITLVFGAISLQSEWTPMEPREWRFLLAATVMIIGGSLFAIMVMRVGEISFTSLFRYSGLLFALALGWVAFGDWPDNLTLLGAGIVMGSGLFTLYREAQLGRKKRASHALRRH